MRIVNGGYQVVDLDEASIYRSYLIPSGLRIPIFPLIAVLYSFAPADAYPQRDVVGIPDFARDFDLTLDTIEQIFDCDPDSESNSRLLASTIRSKWEATVMPSSNVGRINDQPTAQLPIDIASGVLNTGTAAEIAVARQLINDAWEVDYFGNQRGLGYDLRATREEVTLVIEVKSSIGSCTPDLTEAEWRAAQHFGDRFVLAVVDFVGSAAERIVYVRNPAATAPTVTVQQTSYRVPRRSVDELSVTAEFL